MGKEILEKNLGGLPADKRKKTFETTPGRIMVDNRHSVSGVMMC